MYRMEILEFLEQETSIIDGTFRDFGVAAWVALDDTVVGGASYIRYGIALGRTERVSNVEKLEVELNERLTVFRSGLVRAGQIPPTRDNAADGSGAGLASDSSAPELPPTLQIYELISDHPQQALLGSRAIKTEEGIRMVLSVPASRRTRSSGARSRHA